MVPARSSSDLPENGQIIDVIVDEPRPIEAVEVSSVPAKYVDKGGDNHLEGIRGQSAKIKSVPQSENAIRPVKFRFQIKYQHPSAGQGESQLLRSLEEFEIPFQAWSEHQNMLQIMVPVKDLSYFLPARGKLMALQDAFHSCGNALVNCRTVHGKTLCSRCSSELSGWD